MSKEQHRPRSVFLSSKNIEYFMSSERVNVYLGETITAEEGFDLAYGVRSLGYNSTALNISEKQKNNRLDIDIIVDKRYVTRGFRFPRVDGMPNSYNLTPEEIESIPTLRTHTIIVPDGHYTFSTLLEYLSSVQIPSGYIIVPNDDDHLKESNRSDIKFTWTETVGGFEIVMENAPEAYNYFTDEGGNLPEVYNIRNFVPFIFGVAISPNEAYPELYTTLFTNLNTEVENTPISTPPYISARGLNPPQGIYFMVEPNPTFSYFHNQDEMDEAPLIQRSPFIFAEHIMEIGNESIYNTIQNIFPNQRCNECKYIAYYKPRLDPVYLDISISLPNPSIDERGHKNILCRLFTLGSDSGNTSLFQYWDTPKMTVLDGMTSFNNIHLEFESENDKWNFFNLEFSIELFVCEYEEVRIGPQQYDVDMPPSDQLTDASMTSGMTPTSPFPTTHFLTTQSPFIRGGVDRHNLGKRYRPNHR